MAPIADSLVGRRERRAAASRPTPAPHATPSPLTVEQAASGMVSYRVVVRPSEVVFVKGVIEASDGLAVVFADSRGSAPPSTNRGSDGGELYVTAHASRERELAVLLADLASELGDAIALARTSTLPVESES